MGSNDAPLAATLESIAGTVAGYLSTVADEALLLAHETSTLLRRHEQERARMQQSIDHLAVGAMLADLEAAQSDQQPPPTQVDRGAVQRDVVALDASIARVRLLHGRLVAGHRVMRELRASFVDGNEEARVDGAGDTPIQQATVSAREDERRRLAREIHDGPAQVLANAIFAVEIAERTSRRDPSRVPNELSQLRDLLRDGVAEMRRFMADLQPAMLVDRGLVPALQHYVTDYNRFFARRIVFTSGDVPETLTSDQQLTLFRIVQEGLQNMRKHAGTDDGQIDLLTDDDTLTLTIADYGRGFDPSEPVLSPDHGAGLTGIRERARLIGADLQILSSPGHGTTIHLRLPILATLRPAATSPDPFTSGSIE